MENIDHTLRKLHACYCELTLRQPPYVTSERCWYDFQKAGLDIDDLRLTIAFVKGINKTRQPAFHIPLSFQSFIGNLERFGSLLGDARADKRAKDFRAKHSYSPAKAEVLRATGRPDAPATPEQMRRISEVLKNIRESL